MGEHGGLQDILCGDGYTGSVSVVCQSGSASTSGQCSQHQQAILRGSMGLGVTATVWNDQTTGVRSIFVETVAMVSSVPISQVNILRVNTVTKSQSSIQVEFEVTIYADSSDAASQTITALRQTLDSSVSQGTFVSTMNRKLSASDSAVTVDPSSVTFVITYDSTIVVPPAPTSTPTTRADEQDSSSSSDNTAVVAGGVAGGAVLLFGLASVVFFFKRKKEKSLDEDSIKV